MARPILKTRSKDESNVNAGTVRVLANQTAPPGPQTKVLDLQRAAGNGAVSRLLQSGTENMPYDLESHEMDSIIPLMVKSGLNTRSGQDPSKLFVSKTPTPTVTRVGSAIIATVYFDQNQSLLDAANFEAVEKLGDELSFMFKPAVVVHSHASKEGTETYNLTLSEMRRQAVTGILQSRLTGQVEISGEAHGEFEPLVEETSSDVAELEGQRALNRRVSIVIMSTTVPEVDAVEGPERRNNLPSRLTPNLKSETDDETTKRILSEAIRNRELPPAKASSRDEFWKGVDRVIDDLSSKMGVPAELRSLIKDGAHSLIETGAEKALDKTLDAAGLNEEQKRIYRSYLEEQKRAFKAGGQIKP